MFVTLVEDDLATLQEHGSIALITGTNEDGARVTFGVDARMIEDIGMALIFGEEFETTVEVEGWQIVGTVA